MNIIQIIELLNKVRNMKLRDGGLLVLIIVVVGALAAGVISVAKNGANNPVEKEEAQVIQDETGIPAEVVEKAEEAIVNEVEGKK